MCRHLAQYVETTSIKATRCDIKSFKRNAKLMSMRIYNNSDWNRNVFMHA